MEFIRSLVPTIKDMLAWDVLLIFFFLMSGFFYGVFFGRARLLALAIALYPGIAFSSASILFTRSLTNTISTGIHISAFFAGIFLSYGVIFSTFLKNRRMGMEGWWQVFIISFVSTGLMISYSVRLLPPEIQQTITHSIAQFFLSDTAYAVWLILPLAGILLAGKRGE